MILPTQIELVKLTGLQTKFLFLPAHLFSSGPHVCILNALDGLPAMSAAHIVYIKHAEQADSIMST